MQTDEPEKTTPAAEKTDAAASQPPRPEDSLRSIVALLENAVKLKETRLLSGRILRLTAAVRKQLTPEILSSFVANTLSAECQLKSALANSLQQVKSYVDTAMDTDAAAPAVGAATVAVPPAPSSIPEVELYATLLVLMYLLDHKQAALAQDLSVQAVQRLQGFNRRTLDVVAARIYSYYSLAHEKLGRLSEIRSTLLALHRTSHLRHDVIGQETLLNLLLRNHLHYNLYDQAEKFRSKAQRGELFRSHQQYCRYLYYLGRIRAVQLEYSEARDCLQQASRKAPSSAMGFRITCDKWLILVRLLLGEVPDRTEFAVPGLSRALRPYFELTQAVRSGDLVAFAQVAQLHDGVFRTDGVRNLVMRLHHNVLRTGLRRISVAYSRIGLADVAARLHVPSAEEAECIVAKAIRDGAIDAVIDHAGAAMVSKESQEVYVSSEPSESFHARVAFCLDLHNEAVKALRYEPDFHKKKLETPEARVERLAAEAELAAALDEEGEDEY